MKLSYYCGSCKKENYIKTNTSDRHALHMELGVKEINERCKECGHHTKKHINRLHAEPNYSIIIGGVIVAVVLTILLWDLGYVSALTGVIPFALWADQSKKTSGFNRSRIRHD